MVEAYLPAKRRVWKVAVFGVGGRSPDHDSVTSAIGRTNGRRGNSRGRRIVRADEDFGYRTGDRLHLIGDSNSILRTVVGGSHRWKFEEGRGLARDVGAVPLPLIGEVALTVRCDEECCGLSNSETLGLRLRGHSQGGVRSDKLDLADAATTIRDIAIEDIQGAVRRIRGQVGNRVETGCELLSFSSVGVHGHDPACAKISDEKITDEAAGQLHDVRFIEGRSGDGTAFKLGTGHQPKVGVREERIKAYVPNTLGIVPSVVPSPGNEVQLLKQRTSDVTDCDRPVARSGDLPRISKAVGIDRILEVAIADVGVVAGYGSVLVDPKKASFFGTAILTVARPGVISNGQQQCAVAVIDNCSAIVRRCTCQSWPVVDDAL